MITIGQIQYANCTPIFTALRRGWDCGSYTFEKGVPALLNGKLSRGEIDVCPASSIEYAKFPDKYLLLPDISISSDGPVKSVLLFSRFPVEQLCNRSIALTTESETSVNLLKVVLAKQYNVSNRFERTALPLAEALKKWDALLLIGDAALREEMQSRGDLFIYDLGEMWRGFTGLPFVFALWMVTREAAEQKREEVELLSARLLAAKLQAYDSYGLIADESEEREWMGRDRLFDYWRSISYDLTPRHLAGAATFFKYAKELQLVAEEPVIRIFS